MALAAVVASVPIQAQVSEQPRPGDRRLELPEFQTPLPVPEFVLPPVAPPPAEAPLTVAPEVLLREVRFVGNTVFSDEDLGTVAAVFVGRQVSTEDLQNLRRRLTLFYVERGYINSGAVIPDQRVAEGVVTFVIVEGELTEIKVGGNERLRSAYVRGRLARGAGPPLNVEDLQERVQILLQDPLIERIDARLGPGIRPGESELDVTIEEAKNYSVRATVDNRRAPSVGAEEGRADILIRNLTGWGETWDLSFARTEGLREISSGIAVPITARDTRLSFRVLDSSADVVEEPFNAIDIESESRDYKLALTQPVWRTVGQELSLGVSLERRRSKTFLLGRPFSFSEGVQNGRSVVTVARFLQDWLDRDRDQVLALRSSFTVGFDALGATINSSPLPDGRFFAWLGQAQWARRLGDTDLQVVIRADGQFTPDRLLPLEKFAIGGADTVRGYRENQLVRDNGWVASVEARIPLFELPVPLLSTNAGDGRVEFAPFFDIGRAYDTDVSNPGPDTLYSVGAGLRWHVSERVFASFYFGHALRDVDDPDDEDLQDLGIHFLLTAELF